MNDEYKEIIDNAIALYQWGEISQQDMLDIWRRAALDAEMQTTADELETPLGMMAAQ